MNENEPVTDRASTLIQQIVTGLEGTFGKDALVVFVDETMSPRYDPADDLNGEALDALELPLSNLVEHVLAQATGAEHIVSDLIGENEDLRRQLAEARKATTNAWSSFLRLLLDAHHPDGARVIDDVIELAPEKIARLKDAIGPTR